MSDSPAPEAPELPRALTAPEPVIVAGMLAFLVATIVTAIWGRDWGHALQISLVGLGVGVFGCTLVYVQKWAVRKGRRGAQQGLRG
jgi:hypothetical protein